MVLLDNHAVVTDGWLDQLTALAEMDGKGTTKGTNDTKGEEGGKDRERILIGLLGPMSNSAPPPQLVPGVPYQDLEAMEAFARRWRDDHRGKWFRVSKLAGFCLLLKRSVYDRIGGLDERSGATVFDADDLAARARQAGFTMAVAERPLRPPLRRPALARLHIDRPGLPRRDPAGIRPPRRCGTQRCSDHRANPLVPSLPPRRITLWQGLPTLPCP